MCSLTPMGAIFVINLGLDRALASTWQRCKKNDDRGYHYMASAGNNQGTETSGTQSYNHVTAPNRQITHMWRDRFLMWPISYALLPCLAAIVSR